MKQRVVQGLRESGFLAHADTLNYILHMLRSWLPNLVFAAQNPDFPTPPSRLRFEAYGHVSNREYRDSGLMHATFFNDAIDRYIHDSPSHILEWGCGSGRIIRHLRDMRGSEDTVSGIDVDAAAIAWCSPVLKDIEFTRTEALPPIPFADNSVDAIYSYSVFTHLSDDSIRAWLQELSRVLKPGGVLLATTHGDHYLNILMPEERVTYASGDIVTRTNYEEGRKLFLSFHPERYMREVLGEVFSTCERLAVPPHADIPQDVWVAVK